MFEDSKGNGGSANGGGGGGSLAGYATQAWVNEGFVSIDFFNRLFTVYGPGETSSDPDVVIEPNDLDSTIKNIKAMFGLWTEQYLSALGLNPGGTGSATSLGMLDDVDITTPTNGQALVYNSTSLKWENQAISTVTALANLTDVLLTSPAANQVLVYDGTQWVNSSVKTVNGYSILGTGDIPASGGGTGNYLPLAGGTMTGSVEFSSGNISSNNLAIGLNFNPAFIRLSKNVDSYIHMGLNDTLHIGDKNLTDNSGLSIYIPNGNAGFSGSVYAVLGYDCPNETGYKSDGYTILRLNENGYTILSAHGQNIIFRPDGDTSVTNQLTAYTSGVFNARGFQSRHILIECDSSGNATYSGEINDSTEALYLQYHSTRNCEICDGGGNVGIGTTPAYKLHVAGTIYATGNITALSDIKQKNVEQYDAHLGFEEVANAPIIKFTWKDPKAEDKGLQVGSIAQYWEKVLPEAVKRDKEGTLSMSYGVVALVAAVSTAKKVRELDERVTKLEKIER